MNTLPMFDQHFLQKKITNRKEEGTLRSLSVQDFLYDFLSNDYLGLARSKELSQHIQKEYESLQLETGATGSRLLSGNSPQIEALEHQLAKIFKGEQSLLFNSGYMANVALLSCVPQKGDTIIYDELAHTSIKDGARLSLAKCFSFKHNDIDDLKRKISRVEGRIFVVVESVYSMDGDQCDWKALVELVKQKSIYLILDEAHSTGVWGQNGNGLACEKSLEQFFFARVYTFGKAMGCCGACVVGSEVLMEYLINFARPLIYTTAPSPFYVIAIQSAFEFLKLHPELPEQLHKHVAFFNACYKENIHTEQIKKIKSQSPIQSLITGSVEKTKALSKRLQEEGFNVRPILAPTVKAGEERLRICLHTYNTREQIQLLIKSIASHVN